MKEFTLTVSTPDGHVYRGKAVAFFVRGIEGDLAILAGHTPFITSAKECDVRIELNDETEKIGHCKGGILTVENNNVTFLSSSFEWK